MEGNAVLIVDDDLDDLDLISEVIRHLKVARPIHYFTSGKELEDYLLSETASPFLIICDVNLPNADGFSIKRELPIIHSLNIRVCRLFTGRQQHPKNKFNMPMILLHKASFSSEII